LRRLRRARRRPYARGRRQFAALERSLREHPDARVRVRYTPADSPRAEVREQSVRELAETHVEGAEDPPLSAERPCYDRWRERLERALG
jgi:hypothetical protein